MSNINFFTAVKYRHPAGIIERLTETVDDYFYLGGKKAHVISELSTRGVNQVFLAEDPPISSLARKVKTYSRYTGIIPLAFLFAKAILRAFHARFIIFNAQSELERGVEISPALLKKIQRLLPILQAGNSDPEVSLLSNINSVVFKIKDAPHLVFKINKPADNAAVDARFKNMIKAVDLCVRHQLKLLIVPHAKKISLEVNQKQYTLIAEQYVDCVHNESAQEELYQNHAKNLHETARQLTVFISKSGLNDVSWRNIPIVNESNSLIKQKRVALVDLELLTNPKEGLLGEHYYRSRGFIRCLPKTVLDTVIKEIPNQNLGVSAEELQKVKKIRLEELKSNEELSSFYVRQHIITGLEPLNVTADTLNLHTTIPKQMIQQLLDTINTTITTAPQEASLKGKRFTRLKLSDTPWKTYANQSELTAHLSTILQALVQKRYIFKFENPYGDEFSIQA